MRNPFSRKALTASPGVIEQLRDGRTNWVPRLGGTNANVTLQIREAFNTAVNSSLGWLYLNSPAVRTVVDLIAANIAQLDLRLYNEVGIDEREVVEDHDAVESLRFPNPTMTSDQFIRYMIKSWLIYDSAFAVKFRPPQGGPVQFVTVPPDRIEIQGRGLVPEAYVVVNIDGSRSDPILPQDMFHWRGENFTDMRIGASRLETLRSVLAEEVAMQSAIVELAKSGLAEPTWVWRPGEAPPWSNEARTRFEEDLTGRLKSAGRKPPVIEEGMELRGFGVSPRDAQMLEVRRYVLQQVAALYGVPLGMVGLDANLESARSEFYADTLPPVTEAFCRQLNLQVLQAEYGEMSMYFELDLDEKFSGDERMRTLVSASGRAVLTTDEARARLNLPKIEGGDQLITPMNVQVGAKPSTDVMPPQQPGKPPQDGSYREDQGPTPLPSGASGEAQIAVKFDPHQPRDWRGRWVDVPGEDAPPVKVHGDLDRACELLAQGKKVELDQPREVGTLLDKLADVVADAEKKGNKAPNYDLCRVTVPGTNLFCAESVGIPRVKMPQLSGKPVPGSPADRMKKDKKGEVDLGPAFRKYLEEKGIKFEDTSERADHLKATQRELNGAKVAGMTKAVRGGSNLGGGSLFTSKDNYIVDGHHRWAAFVSHELETTGTKKEEVKLDIQRANMGIGSMIWEAYGFAEKMGIKPRSVTTKALAPQVPETTGPCKECGPSVTEALRRHYSRVASTGAKRFDRDRWDRELAADLAIAGLNGVGELAAASINSGLQQALSGDVDRSAVFTQLKAQAPRLAARWVMTPDEMREMGLPQELQWERAGFTADEIDRMRALRLAEELLGDEGD